jgi:predicted alpha/beta hydrolase family esterase
MLNNGYIFKGYKGTIAQEFCRKLTPALPTTATRDMVSADATRQATWLHFLLMSLQIDLPADTPTTILINDSNGCVALLKNSVHHKRPEHMAM